MPKRWLDDDDEDEDNYETLEDGKAKAASDDNSSMVEILPPLPKEPYHPPTPTDSCIVPLLTDQCMPLPPLSPYIIVHEVN
ncbi:hypothetical protein TorRG33x02_203300 [Trema orientale]|uniref:Uncharacterized protein n=1 Tax=Trema orientale TaxID=63057 RepID=A0A2P5EED1_TREOI|nr:hypothetical protein TorRG33x02_203300 [Trema orientale]